MERHVEVESDYTLSGQPSDNGNSDRTAPTTHHPPPTTHTNGSFQVRLEVFQGPLDLLLKLIERKQLDISKVALAEVTGDFLAYLEAHPNIPPGPLASFAWVASKLLWIKSQALLPRPPISRADEEEEDPGDELVRRLEAYKRVKDAARWLRERELRGLRSYERPVELDLPRVKPSPEELGTGLDGLDGVTLAKLVRMVQRRMQAGLPSAPPVGTATQGHVITVADKVAHLRRRLSRLKDGERIPLGHDFVEAGIRSRTELAVLFLALLEVIRRRLGVAEQDELFGEIWLRRPHADELALEIASS
jgi:segregation and condensation protein A